MTSQTELEIVGRHMVVPKVRDQFEAQEEAMQGVGDECDGYVEEGWEPVDEAEGFTAVTPCTTVWVPAIESQVAPGDEPAELNENERRRIAEEAGYVGEGDVEHGQVTHAHGDLALEQLELMVRNQLGECDQESRLQCLETVVLSPIEGSLAAQDGEEDKGDEPSDDVGEDDDDECKANQLNRAPYSLQVSAGKWERHCCDDKLNEARLTEGRCEKGPRVPEADARDDDQPWKGDCRVCSRECDDMETLFCSCDSEDCDECGENEDKDGENASCYWDRSQAACDVDDGHRGAFVARWRVSLKAAG